MFGERLKQLRHEYGISQEELARRAGVNRSYLSMVENEKSSPTIDIVQRLAIGLGVSIWQLISGVGEKHYSLESETEFEIYPGLKELFDSKDDMLLMNPSMDEIQVLKSIRLSGNHKPSKRFFIEALMDYRRTRG